VRVEPDRALRPLYDELYGAFGELRDATRPLAHALGAWQLERARVTIARGAEAEGAGRLLPGGDPHD
jgi:hypothetical protein